MTIMELNELEIAPPAVVRQAACDFAAALAEAPQFSAFEQANQRLTSDTTAQRAMETFQAKQKSLEALLRLNAVSAEEQAELERLRSNFMTQDSVVAYFQAETDLRALCQATAGLVSQHIGLDFAAACSSGCC
jgi:cell fate (sporulation/competence/biofilm development) regulator YlbF (YheA/YmcA/DUF963 family)